MGRNGCKKRVSITRFEWVVRRVTLKEMNLAIANIKVTLMSWRFGGNKHELFGQLNLRRALEPL